MALAGRVPLAQEWAQIKQLVQAGIIPSSERIKGYLQASCRQGNIGQDIDRVISCLADILRLEEELCLNTEETLRDILVVLEASSSAQELNRVFLGRDLSG